MNTKNFVIALLVIGVFTSCRPTQNKCDVKDMLLNKMDFPQGTILNDPSSPVAEYPTESASITASFLNDSIYQVVGRYSSVKRAERKFTENLDYYFKGDKFEGPWETPVDLSFESPLANNYHVACGIMGDEYQCRMIGQYEEYYTFFFAYISNSGISLETFQSLLIRIDDRMKQCVQEPL
jgi:hypothetical protein